MAPLTTRSARQVLRFVLTGLALGACAVAAATEPAGDVDTEPAPEKEAPRLSSRIRGLFDIDLPVLDPPGTVKLIFRPRFGDLVHRDYIRVPVGARWTITDDLELNLEAETFLTHGMGGGNEGYGIGEARFGARYVRREWPRKEFDSSFGFDAEIPTGRPPVDLSDGLNHFSPHVVVQRRIRSNPKLSTFLSAGFDFVTDSSVPGTPESHRPRDHSLQLSAGGVYDMGRIKWTLHANYANTWPDGGSEHYLSIRPGLIWYVPKKITFFSSTQWILGVGGRAVWSPDGSDFSIGNRVRAEITFRQVMDRIRRNGSGK